MDWEDIVFLVLIVFLVFILSVNIGSNFARDKIIERAKIMGVYDNSTVQKVICG